MPDESWLFTSVCVAFIAIVGLVIWFQKSADSDSVPDEPEGKAPEGVEADPYYEPLPEDRIFQRTVPRADQGFKVAPDHPNRNH